MLSHTYLPVNNKTFELNLVCYNLQIMWTVVCSADVVILLVTMLMLVVLVVIMDVRDVTSMRDICMVLVDMDELDVDVTWTLPTSIHTDVAR